MMNDTKELVREVALEVEKRTIDRIDRYQDTTTNAIVEMSAAIKDLAVIAQESSKQLVRYEEKHIASSERSERIEHTQRDQGVEMKKMRRDMQGMHAELKESLEKKHNTLRDEVKDNSFVRRMIVWISTALVLAMIGGGMIFGSITGKTPPP